MKIVVTGASGLIGRSLCLSLLKAKSNITAVVRHKESVSFLPSAQVTEWDGSSAAFPKATLSGADAVVHLSGEPVASGRWTQEKKKEIYRSRIESTRLLVEALSQIDLGLRPKVLVCASAIGIYGERGDEDLNEMSLEASSGFLAEVTRDWENAAKAVQSLGIRLVLLRTGIVLARSGGALSQMKPVILASGKQWMSWIHIDDEISLIEFLLKTESAQGAFNLVSPHPVTNTEFTRALAKKWKVPVLIHAPKIALKIALGEMSEVILASQKVQPSRALEAGFKFKFDTLDEALSDLYQDFKLSEKYFTSAQFIPRTKSEVFSFFSQAKNLEAITPPWVHFKIKYQSTPEMTQGTLIDYEIKLHGVSLSWQTSIDEWNPGASFIDSQAHGPYTFWRHQHEFFEVEGGTLMIDNLRYKVPGSVAGDAVAGAYVKSDVSKIFAYRTQRIQEIFKS